MYGEVEERLENQLEEIREAGLAKDERVIESAQSARITVAGREEVTWWYFLVGRAYRFVDGQLDEISRFEPVETF